MYGGRRVREDAGALLGANHWVFKEAARIAYGGVWQFGAAYGYNHVKHLLRGGVCDSCFCHFALDV